MKTKFILSSVIIAAISISAVNAKNKKKVEKPQDYVFTTVKELPITSIKNQSSSSTCWSFSTISFLESEAIKKGASKDIDLSEMFPVYMGYSDKADKYIRLSGNLNFAPGSSFGDVLYTLKHYGMVPDKEMNGLNYGDTIHRHAEMDAVTKAYVDAILKRPHKRLTTAWHRGFNGILDSYLGKVPEKFVVDGKEYTPKSYAEALKLNADDYVSITSFTHHPYYTSFPIEVPDNWRWDLSYNVTLDDLVRIMDYAIENDYTIAWGADVSENGFNRNGIGVVPDIEAIEKAGSDQEKWIGKSYAVQSMLVGPNKELSITTEMRQKGFDEGTTTDDHGMHIYGIAKDQNGTKYYMVKNSWGKAGKYNGIWYVSEPYVRYKTLNIVVNKNAIPNDIKEKLGIVKHNLNKVL